MKLWRHALLSLLIGAAEAGSLSGRVCMTVELNRAADNSSQFYECAPLTREQISEFNLGGKYMGVWSLRDCPKSSEFDAGRQKCLERKTIRRQQAACAENSSCADCRAPCNGAATKPQIGSPCDWLEAQLQQDPISNTHFMQCTPQTSRSVKKSAVQLIWRMMLDADEEGSNLLPLSCLEKFICSRSSYHICLCYCLAVSLPLFFRGKVRFSQCHCVGNSSLFTMAHRWLILPYIPVRSSSFHSIAFIIYLTNNHV